MSVREDSRKSRIQEYPWAACAGDFAVLKDFLAEKDKPFWVVLQLLDALLRGFGQGKVRRNWATSVLMSTWSQNFIFESLVVFANNPISGLLIAISLAATAPGTLISSGTTAFLGLLLSVLMRDSQYNIANGLTVYNPLLIGAISFVLVPRTYGAFDAFSVLLVLLGTIFSVYLARSLGNDKSPCIVWPFNLAEFALLFALSIQDNEEESMRILRPIMGMDNATSDATTDDVSFIGENATNVYIDWGMVFHGIVVSASQVFAVESVATGSIVYLAVLLFSPATAGFAFLGALVGSFAGLQLGAQPVDVYSGRWGYNTFLTGASLGGNFLVLNGQAASATIVAILYTALVQYAILLLFEKIKLPILTLPFVLVVTLFVKLRNNPKDQTFSRPPTSSFPEKQRRDYRARRGDFAKSIDDSEDAEDDPPRDKRHSAVINV